MPLWFFLESYFYRKLFDNIKYYENNQDPFKVFFLQYSWEFIHVGWKEGATREFTGDYGKFICSSYQVDGRQNFHTD